MSNSNISLKWNDNNELNLKEGIYLSDALSFTAFFTRDTNQLVFVITNNINEITPNKRLIIDTRADEKDNLNPKIKWDTILEEDYSIDSIKVRPKKNNKYEKLDIEYEGINLYSKLIKNPEDKNLLEEISIFSKYKSLDHAYKREEDSLLELNRSSATVTSSNNTLDNLTKIITNTNKKLLKIEGSLLLDDETKEKKVKLTEKLYKTIEKEKHAKRRIKRAKKRYEVAQEELKIIRTQILAIKDAFLQHDEALVVELEKKYNRELIKLNNIIDDNEKNKDKEKVEGKEVNTMKKDDKKGLKQVKEFAKDVKSDIEMVREKIKEKAMVDSGNKQTDVKSKVVDSTISKKKIDQPVSSDVKKVSDKKVETSRIVDEYKLPKSMEDILKKKSKTSGDSNIEKEKVDNGKLKLPKSVKNANVVSSLKETVKPFENTDKKSKYRDIKSSFRSEVVNTIYSEDKKDGSSVVKKAPVSQLKGVRTEVINTIPKDDNAKGGTNNKSKSTDMKFIKDLLVKFKTDKKYRDSSLMALAVITIILLMSVFFMVNNTPEEDFVDNSYETEDVVMDENNELEDPTLYTANEEPVVEEVNIDNVYDLVEKEETYEEKAIQDVLKQAEEEQLIEEKPVEKKIEKKEVVKPVAKPKAKKKVVKKSKPKAKKVVVKKVKPVKKKVIKVKTVKRVRKPEVSARTILKDTNLKAIRNRYISTTIYYIGEYKYKNVIENAQEAFLNRDDVAFDIYHKEIATMNKAWNDFRKVTYAKYYKNSKEIKDVVVKNDKLWKQYRIDEDLLRLYSEAYQGLFEVVYYNLENHIDDIDTDLLAKMEDSVSNPYKLGKPDAKMRMILKAYNQLRGFEVISEKAYEDVELPTVDQVNGMIMDRADQKDEFFEEELDNFIEEKNQPGYVEDKSIYDVLPEEEPVYEEEVIEEEIEVEDTRNDLLVEKEHSPKVMDIVTPKEPSIEYTKGTKVFDDLEKDIAETRENIKEDITFVEEDNVEQVEIIEEEEVPYEILGSNTDNETPVSSPTVPVRAASGAMDQNFKDIDVNSEGSYSDKSF